MRVVAPSSEVDLVDDVAHLTKSRFFGTAPTTLPDNMQLAFAHVAVMPQILRLVISFACTAHALKTHPSGKVDAAAYLQHKAVLACLVRLRDLLWGWRAEEASVKWDPYFAAHTATPAIVINAERTGYVATNLTDALLRERRNNIESSHAIRPVNEMLFHFMSVAGRAISTDLKELLLCLSLYRLYPNVDKKTSSGYCVGWDIPLGVIVALTRLIRLTCFNFYSAGLNNFIVSGFVSPAHVSPVVTADVVARETLLRSAAVPAALARAVLLATFAASSNPRIASMVISDSALSAGNVFRVTFARPQARAKDAMTSSRIGLLAHLPPLQFDPAATILSDCARMILVHVRSLTLFSGDFFEKHRELSSIIYALRVVLSDVDNPAPLVDAFVSRFSTLYYICECEPGVDTRADLKRALLGVTRRIPLSQVSAILLDVVDVATSDKEALYAQATRIAARSRQFADVLADFPTSGSIEDCRGYLTNVYDRFGFDEMTEHFEGKGPEVLAVVDVVVNFVWVFQRWLATGSLSAGAEPVSEPIIDAMDD